MSPLEEFTESLRQLGYKKCTTNIPAQMSYKEYCITDTETTRNVMLNNGPEGRENLYIFFVFTKTGDFKEHRISHA